MKCMKLMTKKERRTRLDEINWDLAKKTTQYKELMGTAKRLKTLVIHLRTRFKYYAPEPEGTQSVYPCDIRRTLNRTEKLLKQAKKAKI